MQFHQVIRGMCLVFFLGIFQSASGSSIDYLLQCIEKKEGLLGEPKDLLGQHIQALYAEVEKNHQAKVAYVKLFPYLYELQSKYHSTDASFWGATGVQARFKIRSLRSHCLSLTKENNSPYFKAYINYLQSVAYNAIIDDPSLSPDDANILKTIQETVNVRKDALNKYIFDAETAYLAQEKVDLTSSHHVVMMLAIDVDHPAALSYVERFYSTLRNDFQNSKVCKKACQKLVGTDVLRFSKVESMLNDPGIVVAAVEALPGADTSSLSGIVLPKGVPALLQNGEISKRIEQFGATHNVPCDRLKCPPELKEIAFIKKVLDKDTLVIDKDFYVFLIQLEIEVPEAWTVFINCFETIYPLLKQIPKEVFSFLPTVRDFLGSEKGALEVRERILSKMALILKNQQKQEDLAIAQNVFKSGFLKVYPIIAQDLKIPDEVWKKEHEKLSKEVDAAYDEVCKHVSKKGVKNEAHLKYFLLAVANRYGPACSLFLVNGYLQDLVMDDLLEGKNALSGLASKLSFLLNIREFMRFIKDATEPLQAAKNAPDFSDSDAHRLAIMYLWGTNLVHRIKSQKDMSDADRKLADRLEQQYLDEYVALLVLLTDRPTDRVFSHSIALLRSHFGTDQNPVSEDIPVLDMLRYADPKPIGRYIRARAMLEGRYGFAKEIDTAERIVRACEDLTKLSGLGKGSACAGVAVKVLTQIHEDNTKVEECMGTIHSTMPGGAVVNDTALGHIVRSCFSAMEQLSLMTDMSTKWVSTPATMLYGHLRHELRVVWDYFLIHYSSIRRHTEHIRASDPRWNGQGRTVRQLFYEKPRLAAKYLDSLNTYYVNSESLLPWQKATMAGVAAGFVMFVDQHYQDFQKTLTAQTLGRLENALYQYATFNEDRSNKQGWGTCLGSLQYSINNPKDAVEEWVPLTEVGHFIQFISLARVKGKLALKEEIEAFVQEKGIKGPLVRQLFTNLGRKADKLPPSQFAPAVEGDDIFPTLFVFSDPQLKFKYTLEEGYALRKKAIAGYAAVREKIPTLGDAAWWIPEAEGLYEALAQADLYATWVFLEHYKVFVTLIMNHKTDISDFCGYASVISSRTSELDMDSRAQNLITVFQGLIPVASTPQFANSYSFRIARLYLLRAEFLGTYLDAVRNRVELSGIRINNRLSPKISVSNSHVLNLLDTNFVHYEYYLEYLSRMMTLAEQEYKPALYILDANLHQGVPTGKLIGSFSIDTIKPIDERAELHHALIKLGGYLGQKADPKHAVPLLKKLRKSTGTIYGGLADLLLIYATNGHTTKDDDLVFDLISKNTRFTEFFERIKQEKDWKKATNSQKKIK